MGEFVYLTPEAERFLREIVGLGVLWDPSNFDAVLTVTDEAGMLCGQRFRRSTSPPSLASALHRASEAYCKARPETDL